MTTARDEALLQALVHAAIGYAQDPQSHTERRMNEARNALRAALAAAPRGQLISVSSIDIERMIAECVPGGSVCDPQQVADAIRRYCDAWPEIPTLAAAPAAQPERVQGGKTGWPPGMLQDDSRELSKWLSSQPGARRLADEAAQQAVEQEPVAWIRHEWSGTGQRSISFEGPPDPKPVRDELVNPVWTPLYTRHQPAAQALTTEQAVKLWHDRSDGPANHEIISYCRAIERAHGITARAATGEKT